VSSADTSRLYWFSPSWESRENFGGVLAGSESSRDGLDGIHTNDDAAAVEPVLNISRSCDPFEVIRRTIRFVLVKVVDKFQTKRIGDKGFGDKTVDCNGGYGASLCEFSFGISIAPNTSLENPGPDVSISPPVVFNDATKAENPSQVGNFIETFVARYGQPSFIRKTLYLFRGFGEKQKNSLLNVKHFCLQLVWSTEVGDKVSVVDRRFKEFGLEIAPKAPLSMRGEPAKPSNAVKIRDLVDALISRDRFPLFITHVLACLSGFSAVTSMVIGQVTRSVNSGNYPVNTREMA
jgi:hypothetical protein